MLRLLHRWPGIFGAVLLLALSISGAALSIFPVMERMTTPSAIDGQTVADLVAKVQQEHPSVEQIRRAPSGRITAYWFDGNVAAAAVIDPSTGRDVGSADPSVLQGILADFHRALFLEDTGRWITAAGALAMMALALSGAGLIAQRQGGWRHWFAPMRGPATGRWHGAVARVAVGAIFLSSVTALWMTAATFDALPDDSAAPAFPTGVSGLSGLPPADMPALRDVPLTVLRDLSFPAAGDATDAFAITTSEGAGYIDQGTGLLMAWESSGPWSRALDWIYLLHTGEGAALWGVFLGLMTVSVPVLSVTGLSMWLARRRSQVRLGGMARADVAETVILVASEGGSTWGFARSLGHALMQAGVGVHIGPLAGFAPDRFVSARQIVLMAATWGDGAAPTSAGDALSKLAAMPPHPTAWLAILGFGDRSFPTFCGFADALADAAKRAGWPMLMPVERIDRQSAQAFSRWCREFGACIGQMLDIHHEVEAPYSTALTLISRRDHGEAVQAPTAILRFAIPPCLLRDRLSGTGFGRFHPGDLLAILPKGSTIPRFYSLASGTQDGFVEIVVRKQPGGLCSGQLLDLRPGDEVHGFVKANPGFRPDRGRSPLILVGAGTGIGPLAGFIRQNEDRRPIHLWFGARHPDSDFLYAEDLVRWSRQGHIAGLATAFSRTGKRQHVQDRLRADAEQVRALVQNGARIMVCGGRDMAQGVRETMNDILAPIGKSATALKQGGRYAEDCY